MTDWQTIEKALIEGYWVKPEAVMLDSEALARVLEKSSDVYDEEANLYFCRGANACTDQIRYALSSCSPIFWEGKIRFYLHNHFSAAFVDEFGKTWAFDKEALRCS